MSPASPVTSKVPDLSAIIGRLEIGQKPIDEHNFASSYRLLERFGGTSSRSVIKESFAVGCHEFRVNSAQSSNGCISVSASSELIVVADAILDNRSKLAVDLGLIGSELSSLSDADLIRICFEKWDKSCLNYLDGDYAFACIAPAQKRVFLARDHIGSRPLYWAKTTETVVFATTPEAIIALDDIPSQIDETTVAEYLLLPFYPLSKSFFRDVLPVGPGSYVDVQGHSIAKQRWWSPSLERIPLSTSVEDVVGECRRLLDNAIAVRLRTDRPVGTHLSGGVDSTGITLLAQKQLLKNGRSLAGAYTWAPDNSSDFPILSKFDERNMLNSLEKNQNIPLRYGTADAQSFFDFHDRKLEFENETHLPDEIPVLEAARNDGVGIMLSGWGGDEAFSSHGFGFFAHLVFRGKFKSAMALARRRHPKLKSISALSSLAWWQMIHPLMPDSIYSWIQKDHEYPKKYSLISRQLLSAEHTRVSKRHRRTKMGTDPNKNLYSLVMRGHLGMRMSGWASWSASYGFQYRYPLADRRLLEFLLKLNPEQLYLNNRARGLALAVLADCLPDGTSKEDVANQALRHATRLGAWEKLAKHLLKDEIRFDCPWIERDKFLKRATHPEPQDNTSSILKNASVFTALRIQNMYHRATKNGWT